MLGFLFRAWVAAAVLALALPVVAEEPVPAGGVYEMGIGVTDPIPQIHYWQQFGFRVGRDGSLPAETAKTLYGVESGLRSIRLYHQEADHGLIRLMVWEKPVNEGLGTTPMKVKGGRWGAMLTRDILNILNHAEDAHAAGMPIHIVPPTKAFIYRPERKPRPFLDNAPYVREGVVIQPFARQILFQRFGYDLPLYGTVDEESFFRTSQITHFGLVVQGSKEPLKFYDEVLGLLRARDSGHFATYEKSPSARAVFGLEPGERYTTTDFDDPRSSKTDPMKMRSGRLKVCIFPDLELKDMMDRSRPGSLGASVYTLRVRGLDAYKERVAAGGATEVTEIVENEFGERSFSLLAPDGYFWTLIEAR